MKKWYSLVVSVLDEDENRREAIEVCASNNRREMLKLQQDLQAEINNGKYDKYADFDAGESLCADIEVRDDETNELLYIM